MFRMPLSAFLQDESFPFFIQYGIHKEPLYLHSHDNFSELVIVLSGSAEHIVDSERYRIRKGDVFVISDETEHHDGLDLGELAGVGERRTAEFQNFEHGVYSSSAA